MMFYLIGLPRCRTAWFANLFTYGSIVCDHDRPNGGDGYSGTVLLDEATRVPSVYIHRPVWEVMDSIKARFEFPVWADFDALERALEEQAKRMRECPGFHVEHKDLDIGSIAAIWEFLLKTPADLGRIRRMMNFNVQVNYNRILDSLKVSQEV